MSDGRDRTHPARNYAAMTHGEPGAATAARVRARAEAQTGPGRLAALADQLAVMRALAAMRRQLAAR